MDTQTAHQILGTNTTMTLKEITKTYRHKLLATHPDTQQNPTTTDFNKLAEAHNHLKTHHRNSSHTTKQTTKPAAPATPQPQLKETQQLAAARNNRTPQVYETVRVKLENQLRKNLTPTIHQRPTKTEHILWNEIVETYYTTFKTSL